MLNCIDILLQMSLNDLKNTLGGQLDSLLSKGLAQTSTSTASASVTSNISSEPKNYDTASQQLRPGRDELYNSSGATSRGYEDSSRARRYDEGPGGLNPSEVNKREYSAASVDDRRYDSYNRDYNRRSPSRSPQRLLFPINSASEEKPRSILKKSILKKNEPTSEPTQYTKRAPGKHVVIYSIYILASQ